ncbi:putative unusual protein kinase regulating ubiquinone biosynthesis (AarF/ABC1/UbiB family) [Paraperlucidibaca baekdonensis]|uniref:Putative unusual protein kinase regulating ubiquinone biosynthesis (AarF/ABC1/UbiB family) n=1 Tax=Paraperlucidibaca baekdonensis TaxID=748120 RepID=A0A3E0H5F2_9GAMM|nr:AarF/ABC1/UbiB kinase family protein [Paraperlucidibaca baekdonensis]REH38670.1 putative unusual protein kinase regulating ubiquinone biosynthesis (AarF/ABC1/UbiB family) [Paraperlucidibaca baekdonensis]
MAKPPKKSPSRLLSLAGMTARIGSDVARDRWQRLWQKDIDSSAADAALYTRIGREIAATLGNMKGAVMKVGQIISQYRDVLPAELIEALSSLQNQAPARPFSEVEARLIEAFGSDWRQHFQRVDEIALASASIAQVHRACTRDGREVVVKVQYPDVDQSIKADLRQLRMAFKIARVLPVNGELLDAIFEEIRQSLSDELDYFLEANTLQRFREFHQDDPLVIIPEVVVALSSRHVLTLIYEPGDHFAELDARYDQATRNALGERLFRSMARQLFILKTVHCDPHPGNFAARRDGSIIMYDFGSVKTLSDAGVQRYASITEAALANDAQRLEQGLIAMGARNTDHTPHLDAAFYAPWMRLAGASIGDDIVKYGEFPLAEIAMKLSREALPHWRAFQPVPEQVMINRAIGGHYWNLRELRAELAMRPEVLAWTSAALA